MTTTLEPTGKVAPQPWMTAPATRAVLAALMAGGREARFVGGCVRDAVLKRPVKDIDIATPEPPERVVKLLETAAIRVVPTGLRHGTVTAVVGDVHFEVTTLRVDVETDGRRARVAFTDDWSLDATRRDFTINTLSCTADGDIYDPLNGLDDIAYRRVRFVGDARKRIEEDLLRLLRFFRFFAVYGVPPADVDALAACRAMAPRLPELSGERVAAEIFNILLAPHPADTIQLMRGERVLEHVLPEATEIGRLRLLSWLETTAVRMDSVGPDAVRRLAALVPTDAAGADAVATRLRLSNRQRDRLVAMAVPAFDVGADTDARSLRRLLHRFGADDVRDRTLIAWASELAVDPHPPRGRNQTWVHVLEAAERWSPVAFPLRGRDVTALGVPAGPAVGRLLAEIEAWWEENDFRADRAACMARLRALAGSRL